MKKAVKQTLSFAAIGIILFVIWALYQEFLKQKEKGEAKSVNDYLDNIDVNNIKDSAVKGAVVGAITGIGILGIQALARYIASLCEEEEPFYTEKHFRERLALLKSDSKETTENHVHFELISNLCYDLFSNELVEKPILHGSRGKKVALAGADFDLALIFIGNKTIEDYFYLTFEVLKQKLTRIGYKVRSQRYTTGISIENIDGSIFKMDILPSVIKSDYSLTNNIWIWDSINSKRQQSNIHQYNRQFVGNPQARNVAFLCRAFKDNTGIELSSTIINKLAPQVLRNGNNHSIHKGFIKVIESYANKMNNYTYCDPCNSNNNLLSKYNNIQRWKTQNKLRAILSETENNPHMWARYI